MWAHLSGINWASLLYASQLLLQLSILATGLYVGLMLVLDGVGIWKRPSAWSSFPGTSKRYVLAQRGKHQLTKWMPRVCMFIIGYVLGQASIFSPIRELHMVEVINKAGDRVYTVMIPARVNPPATHDVTMTIRLCSDGDDLPLVTGMVIDPFQYIQKKDCLLINSSTASDWLRNGKHDVVDKEGRILFAKED